MSDFIEKLISDPTCVLSETYLESIEPLTTVKTLIDDVLTHTEGKKPLEEVVVDGLDANQVWWQVKMVLDSVEGGLMEKISDLASVGASESEQDEEQGEEFAGFEEEDDEVEDEDDHDENEEEDEDELEVDDDEEEHDEDEPDFGEEPVEQEEEDSDNDKYEDAAETPDKYGLNDGFFNLEEFNKQVLAAENEDDEDEDDEEIDYFGDIPSEEEEEAIYHDDFFDKKTKSRPQEEEEYDSEDAEMMEAMESAKLDLFEDEPEEEEEVVGTMSSFEKQQLEIQKQIEQLEKEAVAEKKWTMKGESRAKDRDADALLDEELEFDRTAKPVPVITQEVTKSLEEMIRRRIKTFDFDDLPRRVITDVTNFKQRPKFELSDAKSSKSLAELYEDDYNGTQEVDETLQKTHDEIKDLFSSLCHKLDSLASAHYIPKLQKKDLEVKIQTAAISMEDAQPLTMASDSTLAPQEIYKTKKSSKGDEIRLKNGMVMAKEEIDRDDKNRLRRQAKRQRSKMYANIAEEKKQQPATKKSKKDDVIETLSKAKNITVINNKGERRDVKGNLKKETNKGSMNLKL